MPAALTEALLGEQTFSPPGSQAFFRLLILHCLFLGRLPTCGNTEDPSLYPSQAAGFQDSKLQGPWYVRDLHWSPRERVSLCQDLYAFDPEGPSRQSTGAWGLKQAGETASVPVRCPQQVSLHLC